MRTEKELAELVKTAIAVSVGDHPDGAKYPMPLDILVHDEEEKKAVLKLLKGKHGAKGVGVKIEKDPRKFSHWSPTNNF